MKICRYDDNRLGLVQDDGIRDVSAVAAELGGFRYPLPRFDPFIARLEALKEKILSEAKSAKPVPVDRVKLLAPVANPGKIIAAPVNYTKHLQEALADKGIHHGNLVNEIHKAGMFLKATSAVVGPGEGVKLVHTDPQERPRGRARARHRPGGKERERRAMRLRYIAGFCIGLDMTIRGPEERSFRKSPDSYCVLGPWLVTPDEVGDPGKLRPLHHGQRRAAPGRAHQRSHPGRRRARRLGIVVLYVASGRRASSPARRRASARSSPATRCSPRSSASARCR